MALIWEVNILAGQNGTVIVQPANLRSITSVLTVAVPPSGRPGDSVIWNNKTSQPIQFYRTVQNQPLAGPDTAVPLGGPIPANRPSASSYEVVFPTNATRLYYCDRAGTIRGSIAAWSRIQFEWNVRIENAPNGGVAFRPNVTGFQCGDPLVAQPGDIVSWGNDSGLEVEICATSPNAPNGAPASPPWTAAIPPQGSSTPGYVVVPPSNGTVLNYLAQTTGVNKWYGVINLAYL
jgi:hypothetical protein